MRDQCQQYEALHPEQSVNVNHHTTATNSSAVLFPSPLLLTAMSRQPSPGPSHFPPNNRQKSKNYTQGIAAGAEDAKYKTKYRELKKKVKEIEMVSQPASCHPTFSRLKHCHSIKDNDKLQIKILQSKRNIQRLRLERA